MPWTWWWHRRRHQVPDTQAQELLARVRAQRPEVARLSGAMTSRSKDNHFREAVTDALRGAM